MNDFIATIFVTALPTPGVKAELREQAYRHLRKSVDAGVTADCIAHTLGVPWTALLWQAMLRVSISRESETNEHAYELLEYSCSKAARLSFHRWRRVRLAQPLCDIDQPSSLFIDYETDPYLRGGCVFVS